mgnify:CR=1 FL=1
MYKYEFINWDNNLPIKEIIKSVSTFDVHLHDAMEMLLVLEGSIYATIEGQSHLLKENDFIIINRNELHSYRKTEEENVLLIIQLNPSFFQAYSSELNATSVKIHCNSLSEETSEEEKEKCDNIRRYVARITFEMTKKMFGYRFRIGSYIYKLSEYIFTNFEYTEIDKEKQQLIDTDILRIKRIINYVNENIDKKITLKDISKKEHLNYYYLSHFIKNKTGMSFQNYLNYIRFNKAIDMLVNTDETITKIASLSGSSNISLFNKLFKENYNSTPSEFRQKIKSNNKRSINFEDIDDFRENYLSENRAEVFKKLFAYLDDKDISETTQNISDTFIDVDIKNSISPFTNYWQNLITFGRAAEGLKSEWQSQLAELQKDIGFKYIRFHGIFSDDMMIVNKDSDGNITYNWRYVNELFDYLQSVNLKPFIELGFMPEEFKSSDDNIYWWNANVSQPKDINLWTDLVKEFIKNCINRYGIDEVETWYFEVWNEPDLEKIFWIGTKEDYFNFYLETANAVKSISQNLKVGGPSITHENIHKDTWLDDFITFCKENKVPLDFVTIHIYTELFNSKRKHNNLVLKIKNDEVSSDTAKKYLKDQRIYYNKEHTKNVLEKVNSKLKSILKYTPELHVTEWNASSYGRSLIHDTCFVSNFIAKNIIDCNGMANSLGYWTFTDLIKEEKIGNSEFLGNFGLISKSGLKKPSYTSYYLMSKLGNQIIDKGEDYIVTKYKESIQILAYNYAYFDKLFIEGDTSLLTPTNRYEVYEDKPVRKFNFNIRGLNGSYKVSRYTLNRESGSVFDEWINMGSPDNMTQQEIRYLQSKSHPGLKVEIKNINEQHRENITVPVHGMELITIDKLY